MTERALRTIFFGDPSRPPLLTVAMERDFEASLEVSMHDLRESTTDSLLLMDVFEVPDGELETAIGPLAIPSQEQQERHKNMAVLYYYDVQSLGVCAADGMVMQTIPSPLSKDEIVEVLKQVCRNPAYKAQTLHAICEDGSHVKVRKGEEVPA